MKSGNLKWIAHALAALMLMQSCVVYHKTPVDIDTAIASNNKVKVYSTDHKEYRFKKLIRTEDKVYGVGRVTGRTAQSFSPSLKEPYPNSESKGLVKMELPFEISEVYIKNKKASKTWTWITILAPVGVFISVLAIAVYNADINWSGR